MDGAVPGGLERARRGGAAAAGADVDVEDDYGWMALYWAAWNGHDAVVQQLLEAKADVDAKDYYGRTALCQVAANGHDAVVRLLPEAKADVDAKTRSGRTALY
jgi:ankyrin repeat protein